MPNIPSEQLPGKCRKCIKTTRATFHGNCSFCQKLGFEEEILCHLNRSIQNHADFRCYSFRPILKLVGQLDQKPLNPNENAKPPDPARTFQKILQSDRFKYQRALALQQLGRDPESVFVQISYHFVWNVVYRQSAFAEPGNMLNSASELFSNCKELDVGFVHLLFLAADHLHLYVESDGSKSVESIAQRLKESSLGPFLKMLAGSKIGWHEKNRFWDRAYFVETIG